MFNIGAAELILILLQLPLAQLLISLELIAILIISPLLPVLVISHLLTLQVQLRLSLRLVSRYLSVLQTCVQKSVLVVNSTLSLDVPYLIHAIRGLLGSGCTVIEDPPSGQSGAKISS